MNNLMDYLYKVLEYFHTSKLKPIKTKTLKPQEKSIIYIKLITYMKLHNKIKRCKNFLQESKIKEGPEFEKWANFIDLNEGAKHEIEIELDEIYNVKLTPFQVKTGYINIFELIPDLLD